MKTPSPIVPFTVLCLLSLTCREREPLNPLDPNNPNTRGQAYTIQATAAGIGKVKVHWRKVSQPEVKSYRVYRSIGGAAASFLVDIADTVLSDAGLQPSAACSYFYRLIWEDGREIQQSPTVGVMTFNAPTGLTVTNVTRNRVEMQWNNLGWLDNYARCRIYRQSGGAFSLYDSASSNQYADIRVDAGVTYHYKLMAVGTDGSQSNYSAEAYGTPGNSAPVIDSVKASQPFTGWGEQAAITCYAHDNDGDPISYSWQALDGGTISGSGRQVTFTVPQDTLFTHRVVVIVSDSYSGGGQSTIAIESAQLVLSENFDLYTAGTFPSSGGWRLVWNGAGDSYQVVTNAKSSSPPNSMQLKGTNGWSGSMDRAIVSGKKIVWLELKLYMSGIAQVDWTQSGGVALWNAEEIAYGRRYCVIRLGRNGDLVLAYYDGVWNGITISSYVPNEWLKIKVQYKVQDGTASVWVNDVPKIQDYRTLAGGQGYRQIQLEAGFGGELTYFDDVKVWVR
jgi:hypothetical protein